MKDITAKETKARQVAKEHSELMDVKPQEWVNDVRAARHQASFL
jgi:hypothetical protein